MTGTHAVPAYSFPELSLRFKLFFSSLYLHLNAKTQRSQRYAKESLAVNGTDFVDAATAGPGRYVVAGPDGLDYAFCMLQGLPIWLFPC
jgi:hypothetical protein